MSATTVLTVLGAIVGAIALGVYLFGIPAETKRKLENQALKTMGENKMSYIAKDQINKIPTTDQERVKQLKKGINDVVGAGLNNPIGEAGGRVANQVWDSVHGFSKGAYQRVSTFKHEHEPEKPVQQTSKQVYETVKQGGQEAVNHGQEALKQSQESVKQDKDFVTAPEHET